MFPVFPAFQAISQLATWCSVFLTSTVVTLGFDLYTESQDEWTILQLFLIWNYHKYSILCFTAYIQFVKVSAVFVCFGRGLVVKDTEFPRRPVPVWNLPMWTFWFYLLSDCYILCFLLSKPLYSLSQLESINLYLLERGLLVQNTES